MLPINKSHLRFNREVRYVDTHVADTPQSARSSGGRS